MIIKRFKKFIERFPDNKFRKYAAINIDSPRNKSYIYQRNILIALNACPFADKNSAQSVISAK